MVFKLLGGWLTKTPLKNGGVSSSVGMMTFPIDGNMKNVPNHQPVMVYKNGIIKWYLMVIGISVNGGIPIAGWFTKDNPIKIDEN